MLADQVDAPRCPDDPDVGSTTGRRRFALDQRVAQRLGLERRGHRIVSCPGWPIPEPRMAASRSRSGRPVRSPSGDAAAPHAFARSERDGEQVRAVEPRGDEPGRERIAGPDRVDDRGAGRAGDAVERLALLDAQRAVGAQLDDGVGRSEVEDGPGELAGSEPSRAPVTTASSSGLPSTMSACSARARTIGAAASSDQSRRRRFTSRLMVRPASGRAPRRASRPALPATGPA